MVDFRTSGVKSGGLGIYAATKSYTSPASSSLDKPAGTLSGKSLADIQATGQAAQQLLSSVPRNLPPAERSYALASALHTTEVFYQTETGLTKMLGDSAKAAASSGTVAAASLPAVPPQAINVPTFPQATGGAVSGFADLFKNPLVIAGAVAAGFLLLRGKK
jgi:hypothetical protein